MVLEEGSIASNDLLEVVDVNSLQCRLDIAASAYPCCPFCSFRGCYENSGHFSLLYHYFVESNIFNNQSVVTDLLRLL